MFLRYLLFLFVVMFSVNSFGQTQKDTIFAVQSVTPVVIDGAASDACWEKAVWNPISQVWIPYAAKMAAGDFEGKFKVAWDSQYLYLLVEVVDDMLSDDHTNPLQNWWDDDCVEVFIDENRSKGNHEKNNNAFAYHISLKYDAIDLDASGNPVNYKNNIVVKMDTIGTHTYLWEIAIKNYSAAFTLSDPEASRVTLTPNKLMGLTVAYCDNDQTTARENFIGSMYMTSATANNNYITADYFGSLKLKASTTTNITREMETTNQLVKVFPNPVQNRIKIERKDNDLKVLTVEVRSLTGALVKSILLKENEGTIDIDDLKAGMYLMSIISDKQIQSERIVKQ
ncbi:MAG TPA: sugar-binding protein [Prolixibacteraceae bacterium]|nr:sugar-binding protein [Prolixibacteraceae bacterium]